MNLYRSNPSLTDRYSLDEKFAEDFDTLLEYLQLFNSYREDRNIDISDFELRKYHKAFENIEFLEKFSQAFPDKNIITILNDLVHDNFCKTYDEKEKMFNKMVEKVPASILIPQIKKFGVRVLQQIPNTNTEYITLVDSAVENYHFKALYGLSLNQVLENKDLVIKAYENSSIIDLVNYFTDTLTPHRRENYFCHGEPHSYSYYSKEYAEARERLLADEKISQIFKDNNVDMQISYEQIQHLKPVDLKPAEMGE